MGLVGYERGSLDAAGGVKEVWLVPVGDVASCEYDATAGEYSGIVLRDGAAFTRYVFAEDTASYRQRASGIAPLASVVHELSLTFHGAGRRVSEAVAELAAQEGIVALVRSMEGEVCLVGWSPEFEEECPLQLSEVNDTTGSKYDDNPCVEVMLSSEDVSFSKPFTGVMPE